MKGHGKVILFGEHAVVYGYPALAVGITSGVRCAIVENTDSICLAIPQWQIEISKRDDNTLAQAFYAIIDMFPKSDRGYRVILTTEIPLRAGLGSSAAVAVAIIKALVCRYRLDWPLEKINEHALQIERIFHGTPSGIDNTIATFGGFCYLSDTERYPCMSLAYKKLYLQTLTAGLLPRLSQPLSLVVVNTQKPRATKAMVARVRDLVNANPQHYHSLMEQIGNFGAKGYQYLQQQRYRQFGDLMNCNHHYLQMLQVSCPELDHAAKCAREAGALGAKLTGAGGGGCLIAFGPGKENAIAEQCRSYGFEVFVTQML